MTLTQLEYAIAVFNYKSFSKAAEHCFVTQPTLSMQIQKLEDILGAQIFNRTKNPIEPTKIGVRIIEQARIIIQQKDELQRILAEEKGDYSGRIKIGIIPTIAPYLLPLFLKSFITKYPKIELIIDELTTGEIISGLNKSVLDLGILALPINDFNIVEESLYLEPFVGFIPKEHKLFFKKSLHPEDIYSTDLLLLKEGHCLRDQILKICRNSENDWNTNSKKILFEFGNLDTLISLVKQNFGITLLPKLALSYLKSEDDKILVRPFEDPVPAREVGMVYSRGFIKQHITHAIKNEILLTLPDDLKTKTNSHIV